MREIKFRGQRTADLKWIYGGYHKHQVFTPSPIIPRGENAETIEYQHLIIESGFSDWNMPKPINASDVIPETVGQFTGLLDKNGKEIYEGDIVQFKHIQAKIVFDNGGFCFEWIDGRTDEIRGQKVEEMFTNTNLIFEVIGNIYEVSL